MLSSIHMVQFLDSSCGTSGMTGCSGGPICGGQRNLLHYTGDPTDTGAGAGGNP